MVVKLFTIVCIIALALVQAQSRFGRDRFSDRDRNEEARKENNSSDGNNSTNSTTGWVNPVIGGPFDYEWSSKNQTLVDFAAGISLTYSTYMDPERDYRPYWRAQIDIAQH